MGEIRRELERIAAEARFSGVVRVDRGADLECVEAFGFAHRGLSIANTIDTRFALASGTKSFTALAVMSLVEEGRLELTTTARSVLGEDLPLISDDVTVEHLLAHRSGIGDYLDEDIDVPADAYVLSIPVHRFEATEAFLRVLDGHAAKFAPGERFSYSNGGYVVLALIAERASGVPFHDLVERRICDPAGMSDTSFPRSDEPRERTALGYLYEDGLRTNVLHLPVRGNGDGGIYSTAADIRSLWISLFEGRLVSMDAVAEMIRPRSDVPLELARYGLGFWLHPAKDLVELHGYDAGVSFRSVHDPAERITHTTISNVSHAGWEITERLDELLFEA